MSDDTLYVTTVAGEVSRLLRLLCSVDTRGAGGGSGGSGVRNVGLECCTARPPTTPMLLKILEREIGRPSPRRDCRLSLAPLSAGPALSAYRARYLSHMVRSPLYANAALPRLWDHVASVSERIIDALVCECASEMQLAPVITQLYQDETR